MTLAIAAALIAVGAVVVLALCRAAAKGVERLPEETERGVRGTSEPTNCSSSPRRSANVTALNPASLNGNPREDASAPSADQRRTVAPLSVIKGGRS